MKQLVVTMVAVASMAVPAQAVARDRQEVPISVGVGGFEAPDTIRAGAVTFRVSNADPAGAWLGLVRLKTTRERYLADLTTAMGSDPVEGGKAVARDAEMLGGVAVARTPAAVTIRVSPGEYLLVDFRDVGLPDLADRVRPVRVVPGSGGRPERAEQVVMVLDGRYVTPGVIRGPVRVVNLSPHVNEAMLMPVRPGTTDADLAAAFTGGPSPFTGGPTGVVPLSPGRSAVLDVELPAGPYALVTWVTDTRTGRMFAADGMRALVTVGG